MVLIIELLLFGVGLLALTAGKIPQGLNRFIFGKHVLQLSASKSRLIGLLLIAPLPIAFLVGFLVTLLIGQDYILYATILEYIVLIAVIITVALIMNEEKRAYPIRDRTDFIDVESQDIE